MANLEEILLHDLSDVDEWLDGFVSSRYKDQPLAQDWARVTKIGEELGEAISALIAYTGQNPRKPEYAGSRDGGRDALLDEIADCVITGILAIQHFTKNDKLTLDIIATEWQFLVNRMHHHIETRGRIHS